MAEDEYALTDVNIVDVKAGEIIRDHAVVVGGGKITAIVPEGEVAAAMQKVPLGGRYLSPGLIDCHAHVFIGLFTDNGSVLPSEMTARAGGHLKATSRFVAAQGGRVRILDDYGGRRQGRPA